MFFKKMVLSSLLLALPIMLNAKIMKYNAYTSLEQEIQPSKFDAEGFYKQSYDDLKVYFSQTAPTLYSGGYHCLGQKPDYVGYIMGSNTGKDLFVIGDTAEIEVKDAVNGCIAGTRYVVLESDGSGIYNIIAKMETVEKAVKETRCIAKFTGIYGVVKRNAQIAIPVVNERADTIQMRDIITGRVELVLPSKKSSANQGDRVCVKFAKGYGMPEAGTILYFYDIKDPRNKKNIDPYKVAVGKLISVSGNYGTAIISSAGRQIYTGTSFTTRF